MIDGVRKVFPKFLYSRIFFIGSAYSSSDDLVGVRDIGDSSGGRREKVRAIFDEVIRRQIGEDLVRHRQGADRGTHPVLAANAWMKRSFLSESLPTAYLRVASLARGGYVQSIKTRYRNKLKKRKSVAAEHNLYWIAADKAEGLHDRMFELHTQNHGSRGSGVSSG